MNEYILSLQVASVDRPGRKNSLSLSINADNDRHAFDIARHIEKFFERIVWLSMDNLSSGKPVYLVYH